MTGHSDAAGLMIEHYLTDNIGVALLLGTPFREQLIGEGSFKKCGVLGSTYPMPPGIEVRYHFFSTDAKQRPYVDLTRSPPSCQSATRSDAVERAGAVHRGLSSMLYAGSCLHAGDHPHQLAPAPAATRAKR